MKRINDDRSAITDPTILERLNYAHPSSRLHQPSTIIIYSKNSSLWRP